MSAEIIQHGPTRQPITALGVGTAGTGFTATEEGDRKVHKTTLVVSTNFGAIAGGAALALGLLAYTFPTKDIWVKNVFAELAFDEDDGNITADTPDWGIGDTVGSGANALLSAVGAAAENFLTGQTAADCNGTVNRAASSPDLAIDSGGTLTVYLNIADTWAASGEDDLAVSGIIVIEWETVG